MSRFLNTALMLVWVSVFVTGCGFFGSPAKLYLLEPIADEQQPRNPTQVKNIGLSVVQVPGYVNAKPIASRVNRTEIVLDEDHHWAELPEESITRLLANRMRVYSGGTVLVEPWPRGFQAQARVEVQFEKLLRDEHGGAEVSGQIRIISGDAKNVLSVRSFQIVHDAQGSRRQDFFVAFSRVVNDLARMATDSIRAEASLN